MSQPLPCRTLRRRSDSLAPPSTTARIRSPVRVTALPPPLASRSDIAAVFYEGVHGGMEGGPFDGIGRQNFEVLYNDTKPIMLVHCSRLGDEELVGGDLQAGRGRCLVAKVAMAKHGNQSSTRIGSEFLEYSQGSNSSIKLSHQGLVLVGLIFLLRARQFV